MQHRQSSYFNHIYSLNYLTVRQFNRVVLMVPNSRDKSCMNYYATVLIRDNT